MRQRDTSVAAEYTMAFRDNPHLLARFEQSSELVMWRSNTALSFEYGVYESNAT